MDLKRISSGIIVALAVVILLLIPNNYIIGIIIGIIATIAMHEYLNAISKVCKPVKWVAYISCVLVMIINFVPDKYFANIIMYSIPITLLILFGQVIATDMKTTFKDMAYTFLGIAYISIFMLFLSKINCIENGKAAFIYILAAAWGTDVFAYVVGHRIGKHKFSKVSPKKSIEGCVAGTVGAIAISLLFTMILNKEFMLNYSYIKMAIYIMVLSLIGQIGDFSASCIKRYVDIKDYSNLLPGHGGMLDRIDSVLFIAPFAYMLFTII